MTPKEAREFMDGTFGPARARTVITKLADQVEAIAKERDALAADAARYQWVKKQTRAFSLDMGGQHSWAVTGSFSRAKGPSLDEAIDAAIKAGVQ